jgi:hypothetical protein
MIFADLLPLGGIESVSNIKTNQNPFQGEGGIEVQK